MSGSNVQGGSREQGGIYINLSGFRTTTALLRENRRVAEQTYHMGIYIGPITANDMLRISSIRDSSRDSSCRPEMNVNECPLERSLSEDMKELLPWWSQGCHGPTPVARPYAEKDAHGAV
jgi:hypothetical protein